MFYDLLPFAFLHPISSLQSSPLCHPSSDQFSTGFVSFSGCVFLQLFGLRLSITNAFVISVSRKSNAWKTFQQITWGRIKSIFKTYSFLQGIRYNKKLRFG
ncbi:uncharacterized protein LOC132041071 isoform X5 [Lycium ferocissimum]|uniref:uncharacterized protein LOC132041071 isoform X5 n=1 Tax=Lycium ferocissimum TaxID=112874 RepID=UPI0028150F49|nr:uncharacterized protein LOC132041071 isoform X5 [Lycium ferocissimum]